MKVGTGDRGPGTGGAQPQAARHVALGPRSPVPGPQRGFTLLEVIAAIMLLAIAFTALMRVAGGSIRLSQNASNHSEAALWARSLLDTAFTTRPIQPGTTSGRFDRRFHWQLVVTPWQPPAAPPNTPLRLYQLDLDVMWGSPVHPYSAHFRTLQLTSAAPGSLSGLGGRVENSTVRGQIPDDLPVHSGSMDRQIGGDMDRTVGFADRPTQVRQTPGAGNGPSLP